MTRDLLALPVRHGGLGLINPSCQPSNLHTISINITSPLTKLIIEQSTTYPLDVRQSQIKAKSRAHNFRRQLQSQQAQELKSNLPSDLQRVVSASTEKGAFLLYQLKIMALLYTRELFVTLSVFVTVGVLLFYHLSVSVEPNSP